MAEAIRRNGRGEEGFTLLEILMAMIILAIGGVSIISLFAAAVSLQYESVIDQRKALILADVVAEAQQILNLHKPTKEQPLPKDIEKQPASQYSRDFEVSLSFTGQGLFPPGEGAVALITLHYRGRPLEPVSRVLQRTVFSEKEIKESISYERDKKADTEAAKKDDPTGD